MIKPSFITLALALLFAQVLQAQVLWQGTTYGMTVPEVAKLHPTAKPPADPATLYNGSVESLRVEGFEVVNSKFAVKFYFSKGSLSQVTLESIEKTSFDSKLTLFASLTRVLREKYGKEKSLNRSDNGPMKQVEAYWDSGKTKIGLYLMAVGPEVVAFNLNYQVGILKESDKL